MKKIDPKIVSAFIEGVCTDKELIQINSWMDQDEFNKEWLFNLKALHDKSLLYHANDEEYLKEQYEKTWSKINKSAVSVRRRGTMRVSKLQRFILYASAACLLAFIIGYNLFAPSRSDVNFIVESVSSADSIRRVVLPDASVVWLNANSSIKYLPEFDENERRVLLAGESYFEVTKDQNRPFIVETSDFTVEVLGTVFNVSAYTDGEFSDATLVSGKIIIDKIKGKKSIELLPGQKARISRSTKDVLVCDVDTENEILWKSEFITFEQEGIRHIISKLEYIYGVKIALEINSNEIYTYSGAVARKGSLEEVLASLQNVIPFNFNKTVEGYLVIL